MDKEKAIEEMACILSRECKFGCATCSILSEYGCSDYDSAKRLVNAGYGDVAQSVKEFAEELEKRSFYRAGQSKMIRLEQIYELINKIYGEAKERND